MYQGLPTYKEISYNRGYLIGATYQGLPIRGYLSGATYKGKSYNRGYLLGATQ